MSFFSLKQLKNEFDVFKSGEEFLLRREIIESVDAQDLVKMYEAMERDIENTEKELNKLREKKKLFEVHIEVARKLKEEVTEKGKTDRLEYLKRLSDK